MTTSSSTNKILVVGAGGFVGRRLSSVLKKSGRKIVAVTRKDGDLADPRFCKKVLTGIDTVYYVAGAKKNLRFHTAHPFRFASDNVLPFATFLNALGKSKAKKIIYFSSTIVEYAEDNIADGYVLGKKINELLLAVFSREFKMDVKVIRSAPIYGPGDNFDPETANFIPATIIKVAKAKNKVEVWGQGKRKLQFIYIDDLTANLIAAEKANEGFFTIGNNENFSVNEIVRMIIKLSGKKIAIKNNFKEDDKPTKLSKFQNIVRPKFSLAKGLAETIKYYHG